jgi:hypothetical protein
MGITSCCSAGISWGFAGASWELGLRRSCFPGLQKRETGGTQPLRLSGGGLGPQAPDAVDHGEEGDGSAG